jgi:DUF218 domain
MTGTRGSEGEGNPALAGPADLADLFTRTIGLAATVRLPPCAPDIRTYAYAVSMRDSVATNIIVFGRGLTASDSEFRLSRASAERVEALIGYVRENIDVFRSQHGRVVFSGGWGAAAEGLREPPARFREGNLMLAQAMTSHIDGDDLAKYVDAHPEILSDSTLENALRTKEAGYFADTRFNASSPLGLVAHQEHLPRVDYLVRRAFDLQRDSVVHIVAQGTDQRSGGLPERLILALTSMAFIGARNDETLRRRHQFLVTCRDQARFRRSAPQKT